MENQNLETENLEASTDIQKESNTIKAPYESPKKSEHKKRNLIIIILILAFIGLLIFRLVSGKEAPIAEEKMPVNVKVSTAQISSLQVTAPISGRIQALDEVAIMPMVSGQITKLNIRLGDKVSKGTVLFEVDKGTLTTSITQSSDALASAQSNFDRMALLYEQGAVSLQQYEQAQSQLITAKTSLDTLNKNLSNYTVTSPINGYVTSVNVAVGSMVGGAGGPVATVANTSELIIKTNVSEYLIGKIKVGDPVDIYIKTLSKDAYTGHIKEIAPAPATGSLTYPLVISVDPGNAEIKAGMFSEIRIVSDKRENVVCVPSDAVIIKQGTSMVTVLEKNLPIFKEVTTGLDNGESVEIVSGLSAGETIVVEGQNFVVEGEPISIVE